MDYPMAAMNILYRSVNPPPSPPYTYISFPIQCLPSSTMSASLSYSSQNDSTRESNTVPDADTVKLCSV